MATETLDVDSTVKAVAGGMKTFLTSVLVSEATVRVPILANPFFNRILYDICEVAVGTLMTRGGLLVYFFNNRVISIDKRDDYVEAVTKVESLPPDVDDETWKEAEIEANKQFLNFVALNR